MKCPRSIETLPASKGVPILGTTFDVPADRTIETLMQLGREHGPIVRLRTLIGDSQKSIRKLGGFLVRSDKWFKRGL